MMTARAWVGGDLSLVAVFTLGPGSSGAAIGVLGRGRPRVLGLALEDRIRVCVLERPRTARNLSLELSRRPARMADVDPQALQRLLATEQLLQQMPARAQVDAGKSLDRVLRGLRRTEQEPDGFEINRSAEVDLVVQW